MNLIDTHTHLYLKEFSEDIEEVIAGQKPKVCKNSIFLPSIVPKRIICLLEKKFPGKCIPMTGLHPCSVKENYKEELAKVESNVAKENLQL